MLPSLEIEITADPKAAEAGLSRLGKSITALDAATSNYQKELSRVDAALKANLTTQTGAAAAVKQAEANYKTATAAAVKYSGATVAFSRAQVGAAGSAKKFGGSMNSAGGHTANLGAQINDIGVMLAAGQNPLMLAMQQGTQVNQVFAQMGGGRNAIKGLGAAFVQMINPLSLATLGIIAGGAALIQWAMSADEAEEAAGSLATRLEEVRSTSAELNEELRALRIGVSPEELVLLDAIEIVRNNIRILTEDQARAGNVQAAQLEKQITLQKTHLGLLETELGAYKDNVAESNNLTDSAARLATVLKIAEDAIKAAGEEQRTAAIEADKLALKIGEAGVKALDLAGIDIASGVDAAAEAAAKLAGQFGISVDRAREILKLSAESAATGGFIGGANGPGQQPGGPGASRGASTLPINNTVPSSGSTSSTGVAGSSAVNPLIGDIESLKEALATETETIMIARQEQLEMLQEAFAQRIITQEEFQDLSLRSAQEHAEAMANLDKAEQKAKLDAYAGMFGDISTLMQSENKKLFAIGKAAALAGAIVNGFSAATAAFEKGMLVGGPPVAAAFQAASLVKTGALISSISSQQIGGGSGGASSGGGGGAAAGGAAAAPPRQNTTITLVGNVFSGDTVADMLNEFADRGGRLQENIIVRRG